MPIDAPNDPIPSEVSEFIDFFHDSLVDLRFPDVDIDTLGSLVSTVRDRASELARMNEQVRLAHQALNDAQAELRRSAERGLAYARVYAEGNDDLSRALTNLALGQRAESNKPTRKRKARTKAKSRGETGSDTPAELPFAGDASEAA